MPEDAPLSPPPSDSTGEGGDQPQKTDWRLIAIIAIVILLLIAVYVNRRFYGGPRSDKETIGDRAPEDARPPMSPVEQYAAVRRLREFTAAENIFQADDRTYVVARPASPVRDKQKPEEIIKLLPGRLFDITRRVEGLDPLMLQRRLLFDGAQAAPMFADAFPPMGLADEPKMVFKTVGPDAPDEETPPSRLVIGLAVGDEAKAYPVWFLNFHDVINDTVGGKPILLCWSALAVNANAMERPVADETAQRFGSAGLLHQGAIVAYDVATRSLWSPLLRTCIAGERAGETLRPVPAVLTTWKKWTELHPATLLLTGTEPLLGLPYELNPAFPMPDYPSNSAVVFPAYGFELADSPMKPKVPVFGVTGPDGKTVKAYAMPLLRETAEPFEDDIGGASVALAYDAPGNILTAADAEGNELLVERMFWLNWFGTHPDTEVWRKDEMDYPYAAKAATAAAPLDGAADPRSVPGASLESTADDSPLAPETPETTEAANRE